MFIVQWFSQVNTESKTLCSYFKEETYLGLELASQIYQSILQEESHSIDLLAIQIDKYETVNLKTKLPFKFFPGNYPTLTLQLLLRCFLSTFSPDH